MPELVWEKRAYEAGVDRTVFYPTDGVGVPWNGVVAISEGVVGGETTPHYIDGVKFLDAQAGSEYSATITSFSYPVELSQHAGELPVVPGLLLTHQRKRQFCLAYRTGKGDDGYILHLIYNASISLQGREYKSLGQTAEPISLTWDLTAVPVSAPGFKPTAHVKVDSEETPEAVLSYLEDLLYGTPSSDPEFPSILELLSIFGAI